MRNLKSMLLTLLCAMIILLLGYLGIVESGRKILQNESVPERAEYENAGSNIFYGKIEDDIEIFPWNYYAKNETKLKSGVPDFLQEELFEGQYEEKFPEVSKESQMYAADWYFGQLIAYEAQVEAEEVFAWFEESHKHILNHMVVKENTSHGNIYFYQEILELRGEAYQVKIACGDWSLISFICVEYAPEDRRELQAWKDGKEKMVGILEQNENPLEEYVTYMTELKYLSALSYYMDDGTHENAYLRSFYLLDYIMQGQGNEEELVEEMRNLRESWSMSKYENDQIEEVDLHYSYQVVELKDMILLLVQGDMTIGVYYDPVNQLFCGYNYFYES
ncbi:MAG: hypothetical protein HFI74_00755 [Lachnospiraceae bacterium]|nr:hypothetical protein [Lachnospiraceae bacterium]